MSQNTLSHIGSGLQNLGNTCFFNAVTQCILHNRKLSNQFLHKNHSSKCQNQQWCAFCQMERLFHASKNKKSYAPSGMVNNLRKIFKKFKLGRQQDSHEFLRYLIEGMQDCETGKLTKDRLKDEKTIMKTKIFHIFGGIMMNLVFCLSCKHKSITKQRYYDLNIECQRSNSLEQGLERFFQKDQLKGLNKYSCENCKNKVDATKRFYIESTPYTLTFQLKRFNNMSRKIGKFIKYPKLLNLGQYYEQPRKVVARLTGVIVHAGSTSYSGHYYAYVRMGDSWYKMDDSYVTKCNQQQAMSQIAYILMYQKVKNQPLDSKQIQKNDKMQQQKKHIAESQSQSKLNHKQADKKDKYHENITLNNVHLNGNNSSNTNDLKNIRDDQRFQLINNLISNMANESSMTAQQIMNSIQVKIKNHETTNHAKTTPQMLVKELNAQTLLQDQKFKRQKPIQEQDQDSEDQDYQVPGLIEKRKSKQQVQQNMTLQQMIMKYAMNMENLMYKLPARGKGRRVLRPVNNLRRYQIIMKRKKIG